MISPSNICTVRLACRANFSSWVTMIMLTLFSVLSFLIRAMTSFAVFESTLPVGSSSNRNFGSFARARAIATRCCWPPLSSVGLWLIRSLSPTVSSSSMVRCRRCFLFLFATIIDSSTLSRAVRRGMRLKNWKTNPILSLISASWLSLSLLMSIPSMRRVPAVGLSRAPMRFSMVDLPLPEGPRMEMKSPASTLRLTPRRASTGTLPSM